MGVQVSITTNAGFHVQVAAARRRALVRGGRVILELARTGAPRDTGAMAANSRVEFDLSAEGVEGAAVIFGQFYSEWEETKDFYEHAHGHAHFLELAMLGGHEAALAAIAADLRTSLGL